MLHESPLRDLHESTLQALASQRTGPPAAQRPGAAVGHRLAPAVQYLPFGADAGGSSPACELVADFGSVEVEYAAIRRAAAVMDCPHRGTLQVAGHLDDRREFLNRMLTQDLRDLAPGVATPSFWLNRKGRIEADLFVIELGERMLITLDITQAAATARSLREFVVMEDVQIEDVSSQHHHLAVHGRAALKVLASASGASQFNLDQHRAATIPIAGETVVIARRDETGEPGFQLIVPMNRAADVWRALTGMPTAAGHASSGARDRLHPLGWHAFNIARIEAGTPLFNIDFGPTNLPHETGVLHQRVSFTKGCYLGQEIVARMEHLGKPRQILVGLRMKEDRLPTAGEQVFDCRADQSMGDEIGVVTSSTLSPMLGAAPIAFAMVRTSHAAQGTTVLVNGEGAQVVATVSPLRFWPPEREPRP